MDELQRALPESRERGHEVTDLSAGRIAVFLLSIGLVTGGLTWVASGLMSSFQRAAREVPSEQHPLGEDRQIPPSPRLQITVRTDIDELRHRERALLGSYAWVDRDAGIVRIPVERAMNLLAQRGLPVAPTEDER